VLLLYSVQLTLNNHEFNALPDTIVVTKSTTPKQIVHQFQLRWKKTIDVQAAKRAKCIFLADDIAAHAKQYELLIVYLDAICAADPAVEIHLSCDETTHQFRRIFIFYSAGYIYFSIVRLQG
jgi:hypothetical protein